MFFLVGRIRFFALKMRYEDLNVMTGHFSQHLSVMKHVKTQNIEETELAAGYEAIGARYRADVYYAFLSAAQVLLASVLFAERNNRRITLHCAGGEEVPLNGYTMEELEQILAGSNFYRCYQSFLVNLDRVSFVKANSDSKGYALLLV